MIKVEKIILLSFLIVLSIISSVLLTIIRTKSIPINTFKVHNAGYSYLSFTDDGDYFLAVDAENVSLFETLTSSDDAVWDYKCKCEYDTQGLCRIDTALSSNGEHIAVACGDNKFRIFYKNSSKSFWSIDYDFDKDVLDQTNQLFDISSDGKYIVASKEDDLLEVFRTNSSTPLYNFSINDYLKSVKISSEGEKIVVLTGLSIYLINNTSQDLIWQYNNSNLEGMDYSSDGKNIIFYDQMGDKIYLLESTSPAVQREYKLSTGLSDSWDGIKFSLNGDYFIAYDDSSVYYFDKNKSDPLLFYEGATSADISSNGEQVIISDSYYLKLFDKSSEEPIWEHNFHIRIFYEKYVDCVAISPDGRYILCGTEKEIWLFDTEKLDMYDVNAFILTLTISTIIGFLGTIFIHLTLKKMRIRKENEEKRLEIKKNKQAEKLGNLLKEAEILHGKGLEYYESNSSDKCIEVLTKAKKQYSKIIEESKEFFKKKIKSANRSINEINQLIEKSKLKIILMEFSEKYPRILLSEISTKKSIDPLKLERFIKEMISNKEISAKYDSNTKAIEFEMTTELIEELDKAFEQWDKKEKKI